MIHLYHGEHTVASRIELAALKEKYKQLEVVVFEGKTVTTADLIQATQSTSLFGADRLVIVENLFSRRLAKKPLELKEFAGFLATLNLKTNIVFWEEKELGKRVLDLFPPKSDRALFRPDRALFTFVEALRSGQTKQLLGLFRQSLEKDVPEVLFALLVRQFRLLIMAKDNVVLSDLAPWQVRKFTIQATYFTMPDLLRIYKHLLEIDVKIKSGNTPFSLTDELKILVAKI